MIGITVSSFEQLHMFPIEEIEYFEYDGGPIKCVIRMKNGDKMKVEYKYEDIESCQKNLIDNLHKFTKLKMLKIESMNDVIFKKIPKTLKKICVDNPEKIEADFYNDFVIKKHGEIIKN